MSSPDTGNSEDAHRPGPAAQDGDRPAETAEPAPDRPAHEDAAETPRAIAVPGGGQSPSMESVVYVPLAVTVGDGFKFGCGFFMAMAMTMLMGFVLLAAFFAMTSFIGVNVPVLVPGT